MAKDTPRSATPVVTLGAYQNAHSGRISLSLQGSQPPALNPIDGGIELRFAPGVRVALAKERTLREVAGIDVREEPAGPVVVVRFACSCSATPSRSGALLRLEIKDTSKQPPAPVAKQATPAAKPQPTQDAGKAELERLRETLTAKLAVLNGNQPPPKAPPATTAAPAPNVAVGGVAPPQPAAPPPVCPPRFDASASARTDDFTPRLRELRLQVAATQEGSGALADLADFYLSNGLPAEAFSVVTEAQSGEIRPQDKDRLTATGGIARLLLREPLEPTSPLLAISPGCKGPGIALWRVLAAAAAGDVDGIARAATDAEDTMRDVREPLLQLIAFRVVEAAGDNVTALRAMAGALRNVVDTLPEDEAGRFLLQARIARLGNDPAEELAFLQRAAMHARTIPGLIARTRLAALHAAGDPPDANASEALLADIARTYRSEPVGQDAAESYAERRLRLGDYGSALTIADETAGTASSRVRDSRGAALAARILRVLVVEAPADATLPDATERLALYWRYEGYATPGAKGDDIRIGAARLMLAQQVPLPAVELLRQLSDSAAAAESARLLRASAEARAGDANAALAALRTMGDSAEAHRVAAEALERLGRPGEGAHQLDTATESADLARRADLLFAAKEWNDAAAAYATLLAAPGVAGAARDQAGQRYALALALAGGTPGDKPPKLAEQPARLMHILRPADGAAKTGDAVQDALDRAQRIEQLLPPSRAPQQGS